jgi:hypothetical protein
MTRAGFNATSDVARGFEAACLWQAAAPESPPPDAAAFAGRSFDGQLRSTRPAKDDRRTNETETAAALAGCCLPMPILEPPPAGESTLKLDASIEIDVPEPRAGKQPAAPIGGQGIAVELPVELAADAVPHRPAGELPEVTQSSALTDAQADCAEAAGDPAKPVSGRHSASSKPHAPRLTHFALDHNSVPTESEATLDPVIAQPTPHAEPEAASGGSTAEAEPARSDDWLHGDAATPDSPSPTDHEPQPLPVRSGFPTVPTPEWRIMPVPPLQAYAVPAAIEHDRGKAGRPARPMAVDSARFLGRVARAFELARQRGGELQMRLSPPELGSLRLAVRVQEGVLAARLEAETAEARFALIDNLPALRERLASAGIRVERFDVDLMQEHHREPSGQNNSQSREPSRQSAVRNHLARNDHRPPAESQSSVLRRPPESGSARLNVII